MAEDFRAFVEKVKAAIKIEDVIDGSGPEYRLKRRHGKYLHGEVHGSLVVNVEDGYYVWNSRSERGDVFNWLEARSHMDFSEALKYLAEKANLEIPRELMPREQSQALRLAMRVREEVLGIAARVMAGWLWGDPDALAYARGRGWSDETIRAAGLGFSGRGTDVERKQMMGELSLHGHDVESPECVAILGYRGDVKGWGLAHQVQVQENWIEWKMIPGMMGRTRLVYPHFEGGRCAYLSGRNILGAEVGEDGRERKSFNLPVSLAGERKLFQNQVYGRRAGELVLVEGQADAITLGQWGVAAIAMAGTSWEDHATEIGELRKRHETLYIGLDGDEAGAKALIGREEDWPLAGPLGPMCRVITWGKGLTNGHKPKDANDWLKILNQGKSADEQVQIVRETLNQAPILAVAAASWAGGQMGAKRDRAIQTVMKIITQMDELMIANYRVDLARGFELTIREFGGLLKQALKDSKGKKKDDDLERVETLGGFIKCKEGTNGEGWLLEYLYDEVKDEGMLAWRDPEGRIESGPFVDIEGIRYAARTPNSLIRTKGVLFPNELGPLKSTRELTATIEAFINRHYLLDDPMFGRLASYYVLLTWIYDSFQALPYLRAMGDYGSGKSELMKRIGHVCYRMMMTSGAGTSASLFRALDEYRGTAFLDEMDLQDGGDMANDLIKILNQGAMKASPIWRLNEMIKPDGTRGYDVQSYNIYGPKLIAMRKDFRDQAVASRCLTVRLVGREMVELVAAGVRLHLDEEFYTQAMAIRNMLMRWRLKHWQPEIEVTEDLYDIEIPARLNQVTIPLKALGKGDPALMEDIVTFVRSLNRDLILERSMTIEARVADALVAIYEDPKYRSYLMEGNIEGRGMQKYAFTKHISKIANDLMDEMNQAEEEGEDEKSKHKKASGTTSQTVGRICRQLFNMVSVRKKTGYVVVFDPVKMHGLKVKYGLSSRAAENLTPQPPSLTGKGGNTEPPAPPEPENLPLF